MNAPPPPILIVDAYATMRRTIRSMLQQAGFSNISEDDGSRAVEMLQKSSFALVIADMVMAPLSGLQILRMLREDERLRHTRVLLTTPVPEKALVLLAKELNVNGILVKPFDTNTLNRMVSAVLQREAPATEAAPAAPAASEASELARLKKDITTLSQQLQRRIGMGAPVLQEDAISLIRAYLERATQLGVERDYADQLEALLDQLRGAEDGPEPVAPAGQAGALPVFDRRDEAARRAAAERRAAGLEPIEPERRDEWTRRLSEKERRREAEARRRHKRFVTPVLLVQLGGRSYRTADWSIGGLSLQGWASDLPTGKQVRIDITIEGVSDPAALFSEPVIVVRSNPDGGMLALRFKTLASATLRVLEYLTRHRRQALEADEEPGVDGSEG